MNYEEKYKEAMERAIDKFGEDSFTVQVIFPELAESEDERIRKEIISALKFANDSGVYDKHIAYLEKQKEQKEKNVLIWGEPQVTITVQKPAEWSEEDEKMLDNMIKVLNCHIVISGDTRREFSKWLKSLRSRPKSSDNWKPSEEQMEALRRAVNKLAKTDVADSVRLSIMYDNLKRN